MLSISYDVNGEMTNYNPSEGQSTGTSATRVNVSSHHWGRCGSAAELEMGSSPVDHSLPNDSCTVLSPSYNSMYRYASDCDWSTSLMVIDWDGWRIGERSKERLWLVSLRLRALLVVVARGRSTPPPCAMTPNGLRGFVGCDLRHHTFTSILSSLCSLRSHNRHMFYFINSNRNRVVKRFSRNLWHK